MLGHFSVNKMDMQKCKNGHGADGISPIQIGHAWAILSFDKMKIHQHQPQYALRTIDHTTLYVNHNSLIVLNNFLGTSARSAEIVLTIALNLLTKLSLKARDNTDAL